MKKDIAPEVLAFLKNLPNMPCAEKQGKLTEEDEARIKIMLSSTIDPQAQADREALKQYILNSDFQNITEITNADRKTMLEYLRKYAPAFYKLLFCSPLLK